MTFRILPNSNIIIIKTDKSIGVVILDRFLICDKNEPNTFRLAYSKFIPLLIT